MANEYRRVIDGRDKVLIRFADGYKSTFEQFKKDFETSWVFQVLPAKDRLAEMKKAFKIASQDKG